MLYRAFFKAPPEDFKAELLSTFGCKLVLSGEAN